jgi:hypothetical protein
VHGLAGLALAKIVLEFTDMRVAGVFVRKYTLRRYSFFFKEIKEKPIEFSTSS